MDRKEVFAYTESCYNGEPASCSYACPFHMDLRSFLKKAGRGRWDAAYKELRFAVLFPSVVARLCPRACEDACQRHTVLGSEPVAVGRIERACIDFAGRKEAAAYPLPPKPGKVAVVGAGAAGLSGALLLAQKQFQVTVFDRDETWGGALRAHPGFSDFDRDFQSAFSSVQAGFRFGVEIRSLGELSAFDAVLLATGADGEHFGLLGSWDAGTNATGDRRVFLIGGLTGAPLMEGMAQAAAATRSVEAFILSGSLPAMPEIGGKEKSRHFAPHINEKGIPGVVPAGDAYTGEEAQAEAARCMLCDCAACMGECELLAYYMKKPPRISNDVFMDGQSRNSVSSASITRQAWSCNLCGYCGTKCAEGADLRGLFHLSRADRVAGGNYPPALHAYWLEEMAFAAGEGSFASGKAGGGPCDYAFFPGCRLGASNPAYVLRSAGTLSEKLGAGIFLDCCGAPAYWAGDDGRLQAHLAKIRAIWQDMGAPKLITACMTCERMLSQFLPEIPFLSLYEALAGEAAIASAAAAPLFQRAAIFDPCAAEGKGAVKQAVRHLASSGGIALSDYDNGGKCCGFGGHMQLANPALYGRVTKNRAAEAEEPYIVYCSNCRDVFLSQGKACAHILDVVFGLEAGGAPVLEEKRNNGIEVKKELSRMYRKGPFEPPGNPWDRLHVAVLPEAQGKMERFLITLSYVREALWRAEETGEGFLRENGDILCSIAKEAITLWVLYRKEAGAGGGPVITVIDTYYHRMRPSTMGGSNRGGGSRDE